MKFIETPVFTKDVQTLLSDEEYRGLQLALLLRPEQGNVIPAIYYWVTSEDTIYMLLLYEKSDRVDLTPAQTKILTRLVRKELG